MSLLPKNKLNIKFQYREDRWIASSYNFSDKLVINAENLDILFDKLKEWAKKEKPSLDWESLKIISKAILKSEKYIRFNDLTTVVYYREENLPLIYLPIYFLDKDVIEKFELSQEESDILETYLNSIQIPVIPNMGGGLDGRTYSLEIGSGWNSVLYEWWSDSAGSQWDSLYKLRNYIQELSSKYRDLYRYKNID